MNNKLIIENLSEKNFDEFVYLIKQLAKYESLIPPTEQAKIRLKKDGFGKNKKYEAHLGKVNGQYVSYMIFYEIYSTFLGMPALFLEDFFVLKEYRRKNIGQKLFNHLVKLAKNRKFARIDLCVFNWNNPAIKFYQKNGLQNLDYHYYRLNITNMEQLK